MKESKRGAVFILSFMFLIVLTSLVGTYLYTMSAVTKSAGFGEVDDKTLWLAEAGFNKAVWYLMTPPGSGGQGENWTTPGVTESLGDGSYTIVIEPWDFALSANGSTAAASSTGGGNSASMAIDGNDATSWQSGSGLPQWIQVRFPYPLTINKTRFLVPAGGYSVPADFQWQVTSSTFASCTGGWSTVYDWPGPPNSASDVTTAFPAQSNVRCLRLVVTALGPGPSPIRVRIATLEAIGRRITSTGTVGPISRTILQTVVTDSDGPQSEVAYFEPEWNEQ